MDEINAGTLYIVATPIGNSRDMSPRGTQILTDAKSIRISRSCVWDYRDFL